MKLTRRNILFLASWYPNQEDPTLGIFIQRHAEAAGLYHNVALLHVSSMENIDEPIITYQQNNHFTELIIRYPKVDSVIPFWKSYVKTKKYHHFHNLGLELLQSKGFFPELIHVNVMSPVGWIAARWKKKYGWPMVITEHWTGYLDSDGRYNNSISLKQIVPRIAQKADRILPVSNDLKNALQKHDLGKEFTVVRNVVNTTEFNYEKSTRTHFLVVADLEDRQKNISGILKAFSKHLKSFPNRELLIAGGGENLQELQTLTNSLGIASNVKFLGRIHAKQLNLLYQQALALVLFSRFENLPCAIIEAFCCGTPVITTKVGGIPEIVNSSNGILIQSENEKELLVALNEIPNIHWHHQNIAINAKQNFSSEEIGLQFSNIYLKTLESK